MSMTPEPLRYPGQYFERITSGIDIDPLLDALYDMETNPLIESLWDRIRLRTGPESPHHGVSDIWVRYAAPWEMDRVDFKDTPHTSIWYPVGKLGPLIEEIALRLMRLTGSRQLGGILITRIPPKGEVKPHHDRGTWHSEYYNCKVYVPLQSNGACVNYCENESVHMAAGEAWTFDNLHTHWVKNDGYEPRVTLIVSMRRD